jgi:murein DD-endopeptidase MepM/ murein hydrolase activator NlpD
MRVLLRLTAAFLLVASFSAAPAFADATGGTTPSNSAPAASQPAGTASQTAASAQAQLAQAAQRLGRPALRRGSRGASVRVLQRLLTDIGYATRVSGLFDSATLRAVRRFQRAQRLSVDGLVGAQTGAALRRAHVAKHPELAASQNTTPTTTAAPNADGWAFPIRGTHNYGTSVNRYGAARSGHSHAGQDVLAACGVPLVAARGGKVIAAGSGGAAGNYVAVHTTDTQYDYFYAHLRSAAVVRDGQTVTTGQLVGYVGDTGDASTCHLHFELWDGAWWNGGRTIDPLPYLKSWDK